MDHSYQLSRPSIETIIDYCNDLLADEKLTVFATITIEMTKANKCKSVETPTTGMTSACCKKNAVGPQCI